MLPRHVATLSTTPTLVRAVVPHNNPEIDDELNAHEICYEIRTFAGHRFTAEEFDSEETQEFTRCDA